ncbi:PAS domain-containing hybrid sensor histidine kinase/response regulator [Noviherbaspirillum humi]|nr:PAS domain-containing sensor histidine kinase [Noviherbaspirillum humi]
MPIGTEAASTLLQRICEDSPALVAYLDAACRYRYVSATYEKWFGRPRAELVGARLQDLDGMAYAQMRPHIEQALRGEQVRYEASIETRHGARQLTGFYIPDRDAHGKVIGFCSIAVDVTERSHAEQALRERERELQAAEERLRLREREFKTLVENSPDIILRMDGGMRHLYANPAIERLTGQPAAALLGRTKAEAGLPESVAAPWDKAAAAAFASGREQKLEFEHVIQGELRYFSGRIVPEADGAGHVESVISIAYDVTERARIARERDESLARERTARIQAETAARARDEFLNVVSHELRAPLNGIQSWAHVLENYVKDASSSPLVGRALQGIKTGVSQQVRLIEELLDVTRMMSGRLRLVKQPLTLLPVLQSTVDAMREQAAARHIELQCTYGITTEQVEGDSDRLQQVLRNLLSNALKFTREHGHVWVTATCSSDEIRITVRDDGIGVSPDFLPFLFDRFSQKDTSSTRGHNGLGLGLFMARSLVELHGGRITAESEGEARGTQFSVYLPLREPSEKYIPAIHATNIDDNAMPLPSLAGLRVLLVDDQEEARESLTIVLSSAGARVFAASTAKEVLAWLATLAPDEYPDVLVSDIAMPGEDGYTVLRRIRSWQRQDGATPLQRLPALALTAFAQREDRIRALTAGFQMHVTKPVAPEELIVVIDTLAPHDRTRR